MSDEAQPRRKGAATRDYVDASIDSQRQYAETLFSKSEGRVKALLDQMFEEKMKTALATIRPMEHQKKTPTTREAQELTFVDLRKRMAELAAQYNDATGMKIASVRFDYSSGFISARPLVYMV